VGIARELRIGSDIVVDFVPCGAMLVSQCWYRRFRFRLTRLGWVADNRGVRGGDDRLAGEESQEL